MNLVDANVVEIVGEPFQEFGAWWLPVLYDCWGTVSKKNLMCKSEQEAREIKVGHHFLT